VKLVCDQAREAFSFFKVLHRRSNGCINRLWLGLAFECPDPAFGRSFDCLLYCSLLPFPAQQNVGVPVPAKRLYPATDPIFLGRHCQLVDHHHNRPRLPVELHHQRLDRQTVRGPSGNLSGVSSHAVFGVSETDQVSA
jgi:hypothetical protein